MARQDKKLAFSPISAKIPTLDRLFLGTVFIMTKESEPYNNLRTFTYQDKLTSASALFAVAIAFAASGAECNSTPIPAQKNSQVLTVSEANYQKRQETIDQALNYLDNSPNEMLQSVSSGIKALNISSINGHSNPLHYRIITSENLYYGENSHGQGIYLSQYANQGGVDLVIDPTFVEINEITTEELAILIAQKTQTLGIIFYEDYAFDSPEALAIDQTEWLVLTRYVLNPLEQAGQLQSPRLKALINGHEDESLESWLAALPSGGFTSLIKR